METGLIYFRVQFAFCNQSFGELMVDDRQKKKWTPERRETHRGAGFECASRALEK
jgi:hypothetical protein